MTVKAEFSKQWASFMICIDDIHEPRKRKDSKKNIPDNQLFLECP